MTTPAGNLVGDATIRVQADTDPALRALQEFSRRAQDALSGVGTAARGLGSIGVALGSAIPVAASLAATLQSIAPLGAAAATGFLAIRQATATVQIAMVGMEEAISAAFATGEDSAEQFQEALEGLSPSARAFVVELRGMRDEFSDLQQAVQEEFFTGFDDALSSLSTSVLPVLQDQLVATAESLNAMALGAANAAVELGEGGTLETALEGATQGIRNFEDLPAQVVTGFGQLAAAGAPAFERLTELAASAASRVSDRLTEAFETGRLEAAVERALDLFIQLGGVVESIFGIIGNAFDAVEDQSGNLIPALSGIFESLERFTETRAFTDTLSALAETMGLLANTAFPLFEDALLAIVPIFEVLAEPVQTLIRALGEGLTPILESIGEPLAALAGVLGAVVEAVSPLLPVIGQIAGLLLEVLTPVFQFLTEVVQNLSPIIETLAGILSSVLTPALEVLPGFLQPILDVFTRLFREVVPVLNEVLLQLEPILVDLSTTTGELLEAMGPLVAEMLGLAVSISTALLPLLVPLIRLIARLASFLIGILTSAIRNVVIPAIRAITALLRGDFSGALRQTREIVSNVASRIVDIFQGVAERVGRALSSLASTLFRVMRDAGGRLLQAARDRISQAIDIIRSFPSRAANAIGSLGSVLFNAGASLVRGFINGIRSLIGSVTDTARSLADAVTDWLPGSPARRGPLSGSGYTLLRGQRLVEDFARGIEQSEREAQRAVVEIAQSTSVGFNQASLDGITISTIPLATQTTGTPTQINFTVSNQGIIGSRAEMLDWLTQALDELQRRQRLPLRNLRSMTSGGL